MSSSRPLRRDDVPCGVTDATASLVLSGLIGEVRVVVVVQVATWRESRRQKVRGTDTALLVSYPFSWLNEVWHMGKTVQSAVY